LEKSNRWFNLRPGVETRGKWGTLDGKDADWFVVLFGAPKVVACNTLIFRKF
jgi:hypothetical protein